MVQRLLFRLLVPLFFGLVFLALPAALLDLSGTADARDLARGLFGILPGALLGGAYPAFRRFGDARGCSDWCVGWVECALAAALGALLGYVGAFALGTGPSDIVVLLYAVPLFLGGALLVALLSLPLPYLVWWRLYPGRQAESSIRGPRRLLRAGAYLCAAALSLYLLGALLIHLWPGLPASARSETTIAPSPGSTAPLLAATFAPWYGFDPVTGECRGGLGSTHWNDSPDTGGIVYEPRAGYYCSADPATIDRQLDQIESAGISVLLVSWWGWGDADLNGQLDTPLHPDAHMNRAIDALFRNVRERGRSLRIALVVEPFPLTQARRNLNARPLSSAEASRVFDAVWTGYYARYPEATFRWAGKPLLVTFDPLRLPADSRYTVRSWTGGPSRPNNGWDWSFAPEQPLDERVSADGVVFDYPRFDELPLVRGGASYINWTPRRLDPELREGLYAAQWREVAALRDRTRLIVVYGWNLHGEQAAIEPGGPFGEELLRETRTRFADLAQPDRR